MPAITLDDLCLTDVEDVKVISDSLIADDPNCPINALINSGIVTDPNDADFTAVADGNLTARDVKLYDDDSFFKQAEAGNGCATDCIVPDNFTERAVQFSWKTCFEEDAMSKWCKGSSPDNDPLMLLAQNDNRYRSWMNTQYILSGALGIINTAAASGVEHNIACDFTVANYDGTTHLSLENMAAAESELAVIPDYYVADKRTIQRLRGQGFQPWCCSEGGQVFNSVTDLMAPGGQRIIQLDKKFAPLFDPNGDQTKSMLLGFTDGAVAFRTTTENDQSPLMRGFNPFFFDQPSKCDGVKAYANERGAIHFKGFTYTGAIERCVNPLTLVDLQTAGTFDYSSNIDPYCGWDRTGIVSLCGTVPTGKIAV